MTNKILGAFYIVGAAAWAYRAFTYWHTDMVAFMACLGCAIWIFLESLEKFEQ